MIVCLNEIGELASRYPDYVDWLRANAGGRALWWPVHDMHAPAVDDLRELVGAIRTRLAAGDGVIVHCGAGIGRAGTVAAAVLVAGGAGVNEALTIVRTARPTAGPQTIEQERLLTEFAAALG
jgi:protein-tyrosine phosphatase